MKPIRLETGDGDLETYASVPPFTSAPDVVLWGSRTFRFIGWNGDMHEGFKRDCPDTVPLYTEAFAVTVADSDTPRSTVQ